MSNIPLIKAPNPLTAEGLLGLMQQGQNLGSQNLLDRLRQIAIQKGEQEQPFYGTQLQQEQKAREQELQKGNILNKYLDPRQQAELQSIQLSNEWAPFKNQTARLRAESDLNKLRQMLSPIQKMQEQENIKQFATQNQALNDSMPDVTDTMYTLDRVDKLVNNNMDYFEASTKPITGGASGFIRRKLNTDNAQQVSQEFNTNIADLDAKIARILNKGQGSVSNFERELYAQTTIQKNDTPKVILQKVETKRALLGKVQEQADLFNKLRLQGVYNPALANTIWNIYSEMSPAIISDTKNKIFHISPNKNPAVKLKELASSENIQRLLNGQDIELNIGNSNIGIKDIFERASIKGIRPNEYLSKLKESLKK